MVPEMFGHALLAMLNIALGQNEKHKEQQVLVNFLLPTFFGWVPADSEHFK